MKIQGVKIDGFKNLSNVKIKFDTITALVSVNNFGKSNVLSAIDFGLNYIKASMEDKENMMSNINFMPMNVATKNNNYKFEMEILSNFNSVEHIVVYSYEFKWDENNGNEPYIISETLKMKPNKKGGRYNNLINRNEKNAFYKSSETGRCSSKINVEKAELVVNKLRAYDNIFCKNLIKKLNSMKFYMENNLDAKNFYRPDPIIRKDLEDIELRSDNLPRVIFQLKEKNPDKFDLLKNIYKDIFPNFEDIIVKQIPLDATEHEELPEEIPFTLSNAIYFLFVKDVNLVKPINFTMMSDGAKRIFMILTRIILADVSNVSLIAIEEPENSVHPKLFRDYIQIIGQLLDDCKILITSHSPYIISYLELSWIHVGISRKPGVAEFFSFKKSGQKLLEEDAVQLGMSTGDYLFSMLADEENCWEDYLECGDYE